MTGVSRAGVETAPAKRGRGRPKKAAAPVVCDECQAVSRTTDEGAVVLEHENTCAKGRQLASKRTTRKVAPALAAPGEAIDVAVREAGFSKPLERVEVTGTRARRTPAVSSAKYTAQVVIMTEPEHAALARAWATKLKRVQADVLREIFEAGVRQCGEIWAVEYGNLSPRTLGTARREVQEMADARTERRRKFNAARPTRSG